MNIFRIIFAVMMALHGLIHLIGFATGWNLGSGDQFVSSPSVSLSPSASKVIGVLWLVACMLLLWSAYAYITRKDFWIPAAVAVVLSQALIIFYWHDARWGTLPNIAILIAAIGAGAQYQFDSMARKDVQRIREQATTPSLLVAEAMLKGLPTPVQRWLAKSHVVGQTSPAILRLTQQGSMRTKPDANWMPFTATQTITLDPPAFVWQASIKAAPFIAIEGRDKLEEGTGNMLIKPLALFTVANSTGPQIDESSLIRYLAEMMWYPQAAVGDYVQWESIDDHHAQAIVTHNGTVASGTFIFADDGTVLGFEAQRYGDFNGELKKETWSIAVKSNKDFNGITIPSVSEVTWKLAGGDFTWLKLEVTALSSD